MAISNNNTIKKFYISSAVLAFVPIDFAKFLIEIEKMIMHVTTRGKLATSTVEERCAAHKTLTAWSKDNFPASAQWQVELRESESHFTVVIMDGMNCSVWCRAEYPSIKEIALVDDYYRAMCQRSSEGKIPDKTFLAISDIYRSYREQRQIVRVGLIAGRHDMPVREYIFPQDITKVPSVDHIHDYRGMDAYINDWLEWNLTFRTRHMQAPNQLDYTDTPMRVSNEKLVVYVTGFTPVTVSLVKVCMEKGVDLTLMHYDSESGKYRPQEI